MMIRRRLRLTAVLTTVAVFALMAAPVASANVHDEAEAVTAAIGDEIGDTGATVDDVTIERLQYDKRSGGMLATGVIEYTIGDESVTQDFRRVPVDLTQGTNSSSDDMGIMSSHGSCEILNLDLGPIFLDLLGLQVDLDEVNLDITAVSGAGNLLGNLLCAVAGLLDPGSSLGNLVDQLLRGVTRLVNQLLGALGGLSLA